MIGTRSAICGGTTTVVRLNFMAIFSLLVYNKSIQEKHTHGLHLVTLFHLEEEQLTSKT